MQYKDKDTHRYTAFLTDGTTIQADEYVHIASRREYILVLNKSPSRLKRKKFTIPEGNVKRIEEELD